MILQGRRRTTMTQQQEDVRWIGVLQGDIRCLSLSPFRIPLPLWTKLENMMSNFIMKLIETMTHIRGIRVNITITWRRTIRTVVWQDKKLNRPFSFNPTMTTSKCIIQVEEEEEDPDWLKYLLYRITSSLTAWDEE
jgi:hypothetical protein